MKTIISFVFATFISTLCLLGQNPGNAFEVGVSCSPSSLVTADGAENSTYKIGAYAEYRLPLGKHFDVGGRFDYKGGPLTDNFFNRKATAHSFELLALADFNMFPGKTVSPFFGIGLGPGLGAHNDTMDNMWAGHFLVFADARIGVDLFRHFRVSADYKLPFMGNTAHLFSTLNVNVGWVF